MKGKKLAWLIPVLVIVVLLIIYLVLMMLLPRNPGPIEPFRNLGDVFQANDGTTPAKPAYYQKLYDCSTGELAPTGGPIQPLPGCDDWALNRYERPFNANAQDAYFPELDIQYVFLGRDVAWYYLRFALYDAPDGADFLPGTYAAEIDLDLDGRGDLLVLVADPGKAAGKQWSTAGVQIWVDSNKDVGAANPNAPDSGVVYDGYDKLVFDQGNGADPNGAWARAFLSGSAYVELAFKATYLHDTLAFKWWTWASRGNYTPNLFDLHDAYSHEQAGDPYRASGLFPILEIAAVDSTCAQMWGAKPNPADPAFCYGDPEYQHCCFVKLFPCRIPPDIPGDDPCLLPFRDWVVQIWIPEHPNQPIPSQGQLWAEYNIYLLDPYCPDNGQKADDTPTPTPTRPVILTLTMTPTITLTVTPTITPTRPLACAEWLNEAACTAAGGTWDPGGQPATGGPSTPPSCICP